MSNHGSFPPPRARRLKAVIQEYAAITSPLTWLSPHSWNQIRERPLRYDSGAASNTSPLRPESWFAHARTGAFWALQRNTRDGEEWCGGCIRRYTTGAASLHGCPSVALDTLLREVVRQHPEIGVDATSCGATPKVVIFPTSFLGCFSVSGVYRCMCRSALRLGVDAIRLLSSVRRTTLAFQP